LEYVLTERVLSADTSSALRGSTNFTSPGCRNFDMRQSSFMLFLLSLLFSLHMQHAHMSGRMKILPCVLPVPLPYT